MEWRNRAGRQTASLLVWRCDPRKCIPTCSMRGLWWIRVGHGVLHRTESKGKLQEKRVPQEGVEWEAGH